MRHGHWLMEKTTMKPLLPALLAVATLLSGCTTIEHSTRISTPLRAMEYNSISAKYLDRPTYTTIEKMSDGTVNMAISRDNYGTSTSQLRFSKENTAKYNALIDKFFDWNKIALARGDAITKEIGQAPTWGNGVSANLKFTFHSGNASTNYLAVSYCAVGTCLDDATLYFNEKNAIALRTQIASLASSDGMPPPIDDVYK